MHKIPNKVLLTFHRTIKQSKHLFHTFLEDAILIKISGSISKPSHRWLLGVQATEPPDFAMRQGYQEQQFDQQVHRVSAV